MTTDQSSEGSESRPENAPDADAPPPKPPPEAARRRERGRWSRGDLIAAVSVFIAVLALVPAVGQYVLQRDSEQQAGAEAGARAATNAGPPVRVQVDDQGYHGTYVLPERVRTVTDVPPGDIETARQAWAAARRAVPVSGRWIRLTVEGQHDPGVTLREIRVRILDRAPPLAGTIVLPAKLGGSGELSEIPRLGFDLDEARPVAREIIGDENRPGFGNRWRQQLSLEHSDERVFDIFVRTRKQYLTWRFELDVYDSGRTRTVTVGEGDGGFRLSAYAPAYAAAVRVEGNKLVVRDPAVACAQGACAEPGGRSR